MQQRLDVLIANRTRLKGRKRMEEEEEEEEEVEEEEVGTSFRRFGRRTRRPLDFFIRSSLRRPRNRNVPSFYRVFFLPLFEWRSSLFLSSLNGTSIGRLCTMMNRVLPSFTEFDSLFLPIFL